jgi:hypothetical protein
VPLCPPPLFSGSPLLSNSDSDGGDGNKFYYDTVTARVSDGTPSSPAFNSVCMEQVTLPVSLCGLAVRAAFVLGLL